MSAKKGKKGLDALTEGYLDYLAEVQRRTPATVTDTRCTLKRVTRLMDTIRPGVPLWKLALEDYLRWLEQERESDRSEACLSKYLSHLRGLLDYAWRSGRADRNVLDGFRIKDRSDRQEPQALTVAQARQLIAACPGGTPAQRRDRLVILILYGCGLRTNELCSLNVTDVDVERQELRVLHGKGDRQRVVPVPQGVFTELLAYLHWRGGKRGPLFRTHVRHRRLTARQTCQIVRRAAEAAGLAGRVTPKTLRHSYATALMDAGVDLAVIAMLMGHRSPNETGVYLHVLGDKARQAVDRLNKHPGDKP